MDSCIAIHTQPRVARLFFLYNFSPGILFHRGRAVFGAIIILRARQRFTFERESAESRRKISQRKKRDARYCFRDARNARFVSLMNQLCMCNTVIPNTSKLRVPDTRSSRMMNFNVQIVLVG
jgi:hypothetical protein